MSSATSRLRLLLYSFLSSCSVIGVSFLLQWAIYERWLRDPGPVRVVGTVLASVLAFFFVWEWQEGLLRERIQTQRRFAVIDEMNDQIRNALQTIECITYAKDAAATQAVRQAVDTIDAALRGASSEFTRPVRPLPNSTAELVRLPRAKEHRAAP